MDMKKQWQRVLFYVFSAKIPLINKCYLQKKVKFSSDLSGTMSVHNLPMMIRDQDRHENECRNNVKNK